MPGWLRATAKMSLENFTKSLWCQSRHMCSKAPTVGISTCRGNVPNGEMIERRYGYVIASRSLKGEIKQMQVPENFASRLHKAITFVVAREKENQEWRDQNGPKNLGLSGGYQEGGRRKKAEKWRKKKWKGKKLKKKESKASLGNKRTIVGG